MGQELINIGRVANLKFVPDEIKYNPAQVAAEFGRIIFIHKLYRHVKKELSVQLACLLQSIGFFKQFKALKIEVAGYRILNGKVTQITAEEEIQAIEEATTQTDKLQLVSLHLRTALDLLADRKAPDYRNSIKESISALESIAKIISNNPKDSFAGALDKIKSKIKIHPALERGFKQIYGYTSDADGIRHGLTELADCDFEDAKFMLVSCSAFSNYLIAKSAKAGISFE